MSMFKDLINFIKKLFTEHNSLNYNSHRKGFNHLLDLYTDSYVGTPVNIENSTVEPRIRLVSTNDYNSSNQQDGEITFFGKKKDETNFIKRACIDVDEYTDANNNRHQKIEIHMNDTTGESLTGNATPVFRIEAVVKENVTSTTTSSAATSLKFYKYDLSQHKLVEFADNKSMFPVVDYANMEIWTGQVSSKTATKHGVVRCWQARNNGYLRVNGVNCATVSDAAQHNGYAIVAPGDVVSWRAYKSGHVYFYPFKGQ